VSGEPRPDLDTGLSRLAIWPKRVVYLLLGGIVLWVGVRFCGLTMLLSGLAASLLLIAIEGLLGIVVAKKTHRFEGLLLGAMREGRSDLLTLYGKEWMIRFAAPRHYSRGKLGLILSRLGRNEAAIVALREALEEAPQARAYPLQLLLADALTEAGVHAEEAERLYREVLSSHEGNARSLANLSRIVLARGGALAEAEALLRRAVEADRGLAYRIELAQLLVREGKRDEAARELALSEEELSAATDADLARLDEARKALEAPLPATED
jgi:tetratricopeptide (TPR) repeat protein